jgi:heme-degrading monooxygenase HmoA
VILRITRSRVEAGHESQVLDVVRSMTASYGPIPGLRAATFGRSIQDDGWWLVSITEWDSLDALRAVYGERWTDRSPLPGVDDLILETTVEHYEGALEDVSRVVDERVRSPERQPR